MPSICLCMMVKNEAELIRTALWSVIPHIHHWVIVDTGSTDATKDIIREELASIPGELYERGWVDWATNRSEAITLAKASGCDFIFILDADEKVVLPEGYVLEDLDPANSYWGTVQYGSVKYDRPNIISVQQNWHYLGVTHEYLTPEPDTPTAVLLPLTLETNLKRTDKAPEKCMADVELLEKALEKEPDNARYWFYLAQSYKDSGQTLKAIETYEKRAAMGGWYEEVWYSLFKIAELKSKSPEPAAFPEDEVINAYMKAFEFNPNRAESLGALASYLRLRRRYQTAILFAERAKNIPVPNERLFLERSWYDWRCLDEFAISAFWVGRHREAIAANDLLITKAPQWEHERIAKNRQFSIDVLAKG